MPQSLDQMTASEVAEMVNSMDNLTLKAKEGILEQLVDTSGDDLVEHFYDELGNPLDEETAKQNLIGELGIKKVHCMKLIRKFHALPNPTIETEAEKERKQLESIVKQRKEREEREAREESEARNKYGPSGANDEFKIQYQDKSKYYKSKRYFTRSSTIGEVAQHLVDIHFGGQGLSEIELFYGSKIVQHTQTLGYYEYDPAIPFNITKKCRGGSQLERSKTRVRMPDFSEKTIEPSFEKDCIMGYKNKKIRVKMPCGHVFAPSTLFSITKMAIEMDTKTSFYCPYIDEKDNACDTEWNFEAVVAGADLSKEESQNYRSIMEQRNLIASGIFRLCPNCNVLLSRPDDLTKYRVRCGETSCKDKPDFCWSCSKKWTGGGFTFCGNKGCATDNINTILQNAKMIKLNYRSNYTKLCPEIRACPRCLALVTYKEACKHMTCFQCRKKFCFFCLALRDDKTGWQCKEGGSASAQCDIAPIQKLK